MSDVPQNIWDRAQARWHVTGKPAVIVLEAGEFVVQGHLDPIVGEHVATVCSPLWLANEMA